MFGGKKPEVLVAGAGPVGQLAALALAKHGVRVEIVDTGIWACSHSYALALHRESLSLLDHFGLRDAALRKACPVHTMGLYDESGRRARIALSAEDNPRDCMAVLRQDAIEALFEKALEDAGVKIGWRRELVDLATGADHVQAKVNRLERDSRGYVVARTEWVVGATEKFEVPFVVGADGYESETRRSLGVEFDETGEAEYFAIFEFQTDADLGSEMRVCFVGDTVNVLWPLPGGGCRWSFQLPESASREPRRDKDRLLLSGGLEHSKLVDDAHLKQFLEERAPWFSGSVGHIAWRMVARFERRLAKSFGQHRIWLAGDAAHTTGPVGVQSMNAGLFEAWDLARMIKRSLHEGAPLCDIASASARWQAEWQRLHGIGGGLKAGPQTDPWVAEHAAALLSCFPAHGKRLDEIAAQVNLSF